MNVLIHITHRPERAVPQSQLDILARHLLSEGHEVTVVGDEPYYFSLQQCYVDTPTLADLVAVCRRVTHYIGPDTGVMHVADYFGAECLAYFGSTSAKKSGPVNGRGIQSPLACSPCYSWGRLLKVEGCRCQCMKEITFNQMKYDLTQRPDPHAAV